MEVIVMKEELVEGIQRVQGAVGTKSSLPILSNIMLESKDNTLKLTATDLDVAISSSVPAKVEEPGVITVPAKRFIDIIKESTSSQEIHIQVKKNYQVRIDSAKSYFKLVGLPKDEFPQVPSFSSENAISLPQNLLREMIRLTAFAMSRDEARYILNGILFSFTPKTLKLVATDGRRLAMIDREIKNTKGFKRDIVIPTKTIQELNKLLGDDGEVEFNLKNNQLQFKVQSTVITSRLIEGEFPNYEQVIPKKTKEQLLIDTQKFLSATRRANIFTSQESQSIKIDLMKNRMVISKNTPDVGEVKEEIDTPYDGSNFTIGFNPTYLIDVLKNIDEEQVKFELIDPEKPGLIRGREDYTYIILPMQLSS
jgi:DNA polymerase III subunit beta